MPKIARIDVTKVTGGNSYKVDIPPSLSESGKRERKFFKTKAEAETYRDMQRVRVRNVGVGTALLSPAERDVARRCFDLLKNIPPHRLEEIVQAHLAAEQRTKSSTSISHGFREFKIRKSKLSPSYLRQLKDCEAVLRPIEQMVLVDVKRSDLEPLFERFPAARRNLLLRVARAFFNFAVKREWLTENPIKKLEFSNVARGEVQVFSNLQVTRLLIGCKRYALDLLPYHAIGLFSGIRPEELERLTWEMIRQEEAIIRLPAAITKRKRTRTVDIESALAAWLQFYEERAGKGKGAIVHQKNLRRRLRNLRKKSGVRAWIQDGMRHTYASNWLAVHGDIDKLTLQLGHTRPDVLWQHYHTAVLKRDAAKFWMLYPKD